MSNFDLSNVLNQVNEDNQNTGSSTNVRILYPASGTIKVKLLYNNSSGLVMRKIKRHKVNKRQIPCLSQYNLDCPVCQRVEEIAGLTGTNQWQIASTTRGIAWAEYVSSEGYDWGSNQPLNKGEIVLLMFPWSVYKEINQQFSLAGDKLEQLIATNEGRVFSITKYTEANQARYRVEVDPYLIEKTCETDEQFSTLLTELPSLFSQVIPSEINDTIIETNKAAAVSLFQQHIQPRTLSQQPTNLGQFSQPSAPSFQSGTFNLGNAQPTIPQPTIPQPTIPQPTIPQPTIPQPTIPQPTDSQQSTPPWEYTPKPESLSESSIPVPSSDRPSCFGDRSKSPSPTACLVCPSKIECV